MRLPKNSAVILSWIVLACAVVYMNVMPQVIPAPLRKSLAAFPSSIDGWRGTDKKVSAYPETASGEDDALIRDYDDAEGGGLELCLFSFSYTKDKKTPYPPQTSWVGGGWAFTDLGTGHIPVGAGGGPAIPVKKVLAQYRGKKVLLYYVYNVNGRYTPDFSQFRMMIALDSVFKRKNRALFIQIALPAKDGGSAREQEKVDSFLSKALVTVENEFIP